MPTVILLDVSLSMARYATIGDGETYQKKHMAVHCINRFLDYLTAHVKLEHVCLVVFSSLWEVLVPFTRDYDQVKSALNNICLYDKTCLESALSAVSAIVTESWGSTLMTHVLIVTDGCCSPPEAEALRQKLPLLLPFSFPSKLHVIKLSAGAEKKLETGRGLGTGELFQQLVELGSTAPLADGGEVYTPGCPLTLHAVESLVDRLTDTHYAPFLGSVCCGHLRSKIQLFPAPEKHRRVDDFYDETREVSKDIKIVGFLNTVDVGSPPCVSRHLVLPLPELKAFAAASTAVSKGTEDEADDRSEDGKNPSFTVLLHGALKIENMVAIARVSHDWYGMLYSWADSKKKSNLMISIFRPGSDAVPWLGDLNRLAPCSSFQVSPYGNGSLSPFPVTATDKKSYALNCNCVVWLKSSGLQADIQKILRHARKLPEKQQHFYKELNRVCKAAFSFGFTQLLGALAAMLERECTLLPENAHPDAMLQLAHAANALSSSGGALAAHTIVPLNTNFAHASAAD